MSEKLSSAFSKITSRGVLNEKDIDEAMREISFVNVFFI
ncbi:MAG: signal recognition particle receptor subunit alpha [Alphaproteobacteria bacterium]